jgi:RNA polymerase sigma-70 factor (ECF subfamily)
MNDITRWSLRADAEAAWADTVTEHIPALRRYASVLTRSRRDVAEDLVQECLLRALDHGRKNPPEPQKLRAWLFSILHNCHVSNQRKHALRTRLAAIFLGGKSAAIQANQQNSVEVKALGNMVMQLPEEQRAVFMLVCVEEFSYREAADALQIPIGTVMSRVFRARESLRAAMESEHG